jgi:hypothetical protein
MFQMSDLIGQVDNSRQYEKNDKERQFVQSPW